MAYKLYEVAFECSEIETTVTGAHYRGRDEDEVIDQICEEYEVSFTDLDSLEIIEIEY